MKIAIGCDHIVVDKKNEIIKHLQAQGHEIIDCGTYNKIRTHFPIYGRCVALHVSKKEVDLGIGICGTGIGIANSINKVKGAKCALVTSTYCAKVARSKYHCNIIAMGGRVLGVGTMIQIVDNFINAKLEEIKPHDKEVLHTIDNEIKLLNDDKDLFNEIIHNWEDGKYTEGVKQEKILLPDEKNHTFKLNNDCKCNSNKTLNVEQKK